MKGYLILESGDIFEGISFGAQSDVKGEVVFNTGMTGYPEGFTDPSYYGQILTLTYPLIGNYGVPPFVKKDGINSNLESEKIRIRGLVVSSYIDNNTHWQSVVNLSSWLKREGIPAISGIDTRTLTKILREYGVAKGIMTFTKPRLRSGFSFYDINRDNLVAEVSCRESVTYGNGKYKILLIDCGLKNNQIRLFLKLNTTLFRIPWNYNPFTNKRTDFDAIFVTNGPGDPKMAKETIGILRQSLKRRIPTLGICLGHQILALAAGADTYKLKYGHRSQNQPVKDEITGKCFVTTQNHGYTVETKSLPKDWIPWFTNLNDGTNEGIRHTKLPFFSIQFHPEASPGPTDTSFIFTYFLEEVRKWLKET